MRELIGQQGEVRILRINRLPDGMETKPVECVAAGAVVSHSESGHHHCLTSGEVMERVDSVPAGMRVLYAILEEPAALIQDASAAHGSFDLAPGLYEFRISREYDPFSEQARIVAD